MPARIVEADGASFAVHFQGFGNPLQVEPPSGRAACLMPWRYRQHLHALNACISAEGATLNLDWRRFAAQVLDDSGIAQTQHDELAPLALWWAAGGDEEPRSAPQAGAWVELGSARVRLQTWSERQRLSALIAAFTEGTDGGDWFDAVGYLDSMVRESVAELVGAHAVDELDAAATAGLLHATVALNVLDPDAEALVHGGAQAQQVAARTLRLCRALGWTPSQVWAAPAAEVDRLLALLDLLEPGTRHVAAPSSRLAEHPDAVVINIDDVDDAIS
ncbi:MAG: hypothetical protein IH605_02500 [Burkholderiales bacterium]|nr:hypothetical protein [Burkholderiales bacterium]